MMNLRSLYSSRRFALLLCVLTGLAPPAAPAGEAAPFEIRPEALPEAELMDLYLDSLEHYTNYAVGLWQDWPAVSRAGYFGNGISRGNEGIRANGATALAFALLYQERDSLEISRLSRDELLEKAVASTRYSAMTYATGDHPTVDGEKWGVRGWHHRQCSLWAGNVGLAAWLIWDELDSETREAVEKMLAREADQFVGRRPPSQLLLDTKAEENAWGAVSPALAANMFPEREEAAQWREAAIRYMMNALSVESDWEDETIVDGKPVREWVETCNAHPDFTLENHRFFHPNYAAVTAMMLGDASIFFGLAGNPVPAAASHHVLDGWRLLQHIATATGEWAYPSGLDWSLHSYEQISYLARLATYFKDPVARTLESRTAQYAFQRQQINSDGRFTGDSVGRSGFYREAVQARRTAFAYLHHKLWGTPDESIPYADFARSLYGTRNLPYVGIVLHRTADKLASASWVHKAMGNVTPDSEHYLDDPYVITPHQATLIGRLTDSAPKAVGYTVALAPDGFATAAELRENGIDRYVAIISLPGAPVVQLESAAAREPTVLTRNEGLLIAIQNDELSGNKRTLFSEDARVELEADTDPYLVEIAGRWANIDDRFGMAVLGGSGMAYRKGRGYNRRGAREDFWYGSYSEGLGAVDAGARAVSRAAVILPNTGQALTQKVSGSLQRLDLPDTLTGVSFQGPDGVHHSAFANLGDNDLSAKIPMETGAGTREIALTISPLAAGFICWRDGELVETSGSFNPESAELEVRQEIQAPPASQ